MFTMIDVAPVDCSEFMKGALEKCAELDQPGNRAEFIRYKGTNVYRSPYGIRIQYDTRIMQFPKELEGVTVTHVTMAAGSWDSGYIVPGKYLRRRACAHVEAGRYQQSGDVYNRFVIEAGTLLQANRLFDDIVSGKATPTVKYSRM